MEVRRKGWIIAVSLFLSACFAIDTEDAARDLAGRWVFLGATRSFVSQDTCTVARFSLTSDTVRGTGGPKPVRSIDAAVKALKADVTVLFDMPGATPNQISEALMTSNLFEGLGLLSSFVGPSRRCMDDTYAAAVAVALMSPEARLIYDPVTNAMLMLYPPGSEAFFLRGNL